MFGNTIQFYLMGCANRHMGRLFSCFQGVWCVFLGQSASLWLCWWGLLWRTPAFVPALKRGRWWVHLLQLLQHSYNCKIYWVIFQSHSYCELQYQCWLSEDTQTPVSNMEETNSKAKLVHQVAGVFDIKYLQYFTSLVNIKSWSYEYTIFS